jgi:hypothetical protein
MQSLAKTFGLLALAATIVPPVLFMLKIMPLDPMKWTMFAATIVWFVTAPMWMKTSD